MGSKIPILSINETVPDGPPGTQFESANRLNWIVFVVNEGPGSLFLSFDRPHPVSNPIEIPSETAIRDIPIAGGFETVWIAGEVGGPSDIRMLAVYRSDLPSREEEIETREGILETLIEIRRILDTTNNAGG